LFCSFNIEESININRDIFVGSRKQNQKWFVEKKEKK